MRTPWNTSACLQVNRCLRWQKLGLRWFVNPSWRHACYAQLVCKSEALLIASICNPTAAAIELLLSQRRPFIFFSRSYGKRIYHSAGSLQYK